VRNTTFSIIIMNTHKFCAAPPHPPPRNNVGEVPTQHCTQKGGVGGEYPGRCSNNMETVVFRRTARKKGFSTTKRDEIFLLRVTPQYKDK
jgi:hypothetical protein